MTDKIGTDLFGNGQHSLFGDAENRIPHPKQASAEPDPERVRVKLYALLETARNAERMPWDARKAGMWQIVFPQMANWLPDAERDQLRFEFAQEIERLKLAAQGGASRITGDLEGVMLGTSIFQ